MYLFIGIEILEEERQDKTSVEMIDRDYDLGSYHEVKSFDRIMIWDRWFTVHRGLSRWALLSIHRNGVLHFTSFMPP